MRFQLFCVYLAPHHSLFQERIYESAKRCWEQKYFEVSVIGRTPFISGIGHCGHLQHGWLAQVG
jgi:hypothetical protein